MRLDATPLRLWSLSEAVRVCYALAQYVTRVCRIVSGCLGWQPIMNTCIGGSCEQCGPFECCSPSVWLDLGLAAVASGEASTLQVQHDPVSQTSSLHAARAPQQVKRLPESALGQLVMVTYSQAEGASLLQYCCLGIVFVRGTVSRAVPSPRQRTRATCQAIAGVCALNANMNASSNAATN